MPRLMLGQCDKCGSQVIRRGGIDLCSRCRHVRGSQHAERLKSEFGQVIRPHQAGTLGDSTVSPVDDEEPMVGFPKGRRNQPLKFEE